MSTFNNEKYALKPVICEGRQFSVICHVKAILKGFGIAFFLYGRTMLLIYTVFILGVRLMSFGYHTLLIHNTTYLRSCMILPLTMNTIYTRPYPLYPSAASQYREPVPPWRPPHYPRGTAFILHYPIELPPLEMPVGVGPLSASPRVSRGGKDSYFWTGLRTSPTKQSLFLFAFIFFLLFLLRHSSMSLARH